VTVVLIATPGASNANSYATLAEANDYLAARLNVGAWTAATEQTKIIALVEAQRTLTPYPWLGRRSSGTQALSWPRTECPDPDAAYDGIYQDPIDVVYINSAIVPTRVKYAQIELALETVKAGTADLAGPDPLAGVKRKKVDVLETEWMDGGFRPSGAARFPRVVDQIRPLLASQGGSIPVQRR
jgi:hypothetical protein